MAFKKCTSGVAWSKGRKNLESVQLTVYEKQYFRPVLTCPNLSEPVRTCPQYNDHVRSSGCHFLHFRMLLFFSITSYPAEMAHSNSPNGELSYGDGLWNCIEIEKLIPLGAHA